MSRCAISVSSLFTLLLLLCASRSSLGQGVDSVATTGPDPGTTLEDRVEITWWTSTTPINTSSFSIRRSDKSKVPLDTVLVGATGPATSIYDDFTGIPGVEYDYCVFMRLADESETLVGCDVGARVIAPPTGFEASDGLYEEWVSLRWTDRSEIEDGYNIYRDAGNALSLDGVDDYVSIAGTTTLPSSFTVEFWAARGPVGGNQYIVNLENSPQGNPTTYDLEIGFDNGNHFVVGFGSIQLVTGGTYTDSDWHHWAVTYDEVSRERTVYRDGVEVVSDTYAQPFASVGDLEFGRRSQIGNVNNRGHFRGRIDEVRIWSADLSAAQIPEVMTTLPLATEPTLLGMWPMDVLSGTQVPDLVGAMTGTIHDANSDGTDWVPTGVPDFRRQIGPNLTLYIDRAAVPDYQSYSYRIAAFEDADDDGLFMLGTDWKSGEKSDDGWRATLSPPGNVSATDGQFLDRVRIVWTDRSDSESGFNVYRDGGLAGSVPTDSTLFDDYGATGTHEYCIAASNGVESVRVCDMGRKGALAGPDSVKATNRELDDRVLVTWLDTTDTEDGFEIFRDDELIGTTGEGAQEYNDFGAVQEEDYAYCVRSFSRADPENPSYSVKVCAPSDGARAGVLPPESVMATDDEFEDRVEISWGSTSATVMLFKVYRNDLLIDVLDFNMTRTVDTGIPSDSALNYCVGSETVIAPAAAATAVQGQVSQILQNIRYQDAVRIEGGGEPSSPQEMLAAVYQSMGTGSLSKAGGMDADGYFASDTLCNVGSRLLQGPTDVNATDDEFENHVQVTWADNSGSEAGYYLYRAPVDSTPIPLDTLSANRTTYGDYTGVPGMQYEYTVQAFDKWDTSSSDSDRGIRTLDPPTALIASDGTSESIIQLDWRDNSDAEKGYKIYRWPLSGGDTLQIGLTGRNEPAYTDTVSSTFLGDRYRYFVTAYDEYGESLPASDIGGTMLEAPVNVNASDSYIDQIVVVWIDRSNVENWYRLTGRQIGNDLFRLDTLLPAGTTIFFDNTVSEDVEYEYCVSTLLNGPAADVFSPPVCDIGFRRSPAPIGGLQALKVNSPYEKEYWGGRNPRFGASVALEEETALIGAPGVENRTDPLDFFDLFSPGPDSSRWGSVYRYHYEDSGIPWTEEEFWLGDFLEGLEGKGDYGAALDLRDSVAVIGDPFFGVNRGGYSIWGREGGGEWTERLDTLNAPGGHPDNTGVAVAVAEGYVLIGNDVFSPLAIPSNGSAVVCDAQDPSTCATPARLEAALDGDRVANAEFGAAVDITRVEDTLYAIVGSPARDVAWLFRCNVVASNCLADSTWTVADKLTSLFPGGNQYGAAVAINGEVAVVGAPGAQAMIIYERKDGDYQPKALFVPEEEAAGFGSSVAVNDLTIIVGAPNESIASLSNAGAVYVFQWDSTADALSEPFRYDARVAGNTFGSKGQVRQGARFGTSVAVSAEWYLVGAPLDARYSSTDGAAYFIPVGLPPPSTQIIPSYVSLVTPGGVRASDGKAPDRIQVRWDDRSNGEDGHYIYRSVEGNALETVGEAAANVELFDDFEAAPGEAYKYCVAPFYGDAVQEFACDVGWRPANGTIAGRVSARLGGGTEGALVCLEPNLSRSLLFDGIGGFVEAPLDTDLADQMLTVEAWVRPEAVDGLRYVAAEKDTWAFAIADGQLSVKLKDESAMVSSFASPIVPGEWHHVAFTTGAFGQPVLFYLNGDTLYGGGWVALSGEGRDTLAIGQLGDGSGFFGGAIDELRIWNTVRPDSLILATSLNALEGDEENLVGYWPMDEGLRRVTPDLTESANHGELIGGVYLGDQGAPLNTCDLTEDEGNFSISRIPYGLTDEFSVIPTKAGRKFEPSFKKITLSTDSPVQNELQFTDVTAYTVAGRVAYLDYVSDDTMYCAVPEVRIHVDKNSVATDENVRATSGADGSFAVAVDPSTSETDVWYVVPQFMDPDNAEISHDFDPPVTELVVTSDTFGVDFFDLTRNTLSGHFSGGDPDICGKFIGKAVIRVYTQDGCYSRVDTVDSAVNQGAFSFDLPPLEYLVEVVTVFDVPEATRDEVTTFFENLGTLEVDLRSGNVERNLVYRAPLVLSVIGLDPLSCPGDQIKQYDESGSPIRVLPEVPRIGEYEFVPLTIRVREDYGNDQYCDVDEGNVVIYDAISDRADVDSTMALKNGKVEYVTFGASPNIFSGARIGGVDRSFQKPITIIAQVEGREYLTETQWAIVEGFRERSATFVSATTEELPLMILRDPPGSNSFSFLEEGSTFCNRISSLKMTNLAAGLEVDAEFGFKMRTIALFPFAGTEIETGNGVVIGARGVTGQETTSLCTDGESSTFGTNRVTCEPSREICVSTTTTFATSDDPTWVGEDIHIGVALNLIFAIADVLELDEAECSVNLSETLAADLNSANPFETSYAYGTSHIELSLIPELENLIKLAGDASVEGSLEGRNQIIRLEEALENWRLQLYNNELRAEQALANPEVNRSFSGGTETTFVESHDTTTVTNFESTRVYWDASGYVGGTLNFWIAAVSAKAVVEFQAEWVYESDSTESGSKTVGYTLKDGDTGDYFSVDVAKDPLYKTFVFETKSGRSSNPHEANTQKRDNPMISVDPPVLYNVDPDEGAPFQLTLINGSESNERRRYTMAVPGETNPGNLGVTVTGDLLGGNRLESFLIDPGKAITINMDVLRVSPPFAYKRVGVVLYPEDEFHIWLADVRQPFALADTAWFSVYFDSTGGGALAAAMDEGWNWFSLNREGGDVNRVLERLDAHDGDIIRSQSAESKYDSTRGWRGSLTALRPGEGYRIKLLEPTVFRVDGDAIESAKPIDLKSGWNWVGYLPKRRMPINQALASLRGKATSGDIVVGQNTFAQYVDGRGWIGTLEMMEPGEGYAINVTTSAKLAYPGPDEKQAQTALRSRRLTTEGPDWQIDPGRFDGVMTMVVEVELGGNPVDQTATRVAVFAGDSLRGVGDIDYIESLDKYLAFVMIYGSATEADDEELRVHVYDGERNKVYEDVGSLKYVAQSMVGQPDNPAILELTMAGKAPALLDLPEEFALHGNYPNPFNPTTTIAYDLPSATHVNLTVFDVLGRRVATVVDAEHRAGRHKVLFDASQLASGFYVYRIQAGDFKEVRKMILVK